MELHPCACGEARAPTEHRLESADAGLVAVYDGTCVRCKRPRSFEFALHPELVPANKFGGAQPSTLIDAGQFLAAADVAAKTRPARRISLERAVGAIEEVLKFIPPGAERVPEDAFFSEAGRAVLAREPGRFARARLEAVLATYRAELSKLRE